MGYVTKDEVLVLNWLPIAEYIDFSAAKLVHQALDSESLARYLKLETVHYSRNTRLSQRWSKSKTWRKVYFSRPS